jgi:hypothetical protein
MIGPSFGSLARSAGQHGALSFCEDRLFAGAVEGVNVSSRPPWNAEETDACFIVKDSTGRALAYAYYEEEPGRRTSANLLTKHRWAQVGLSVHKRNEPRDPGPECWGSFQLGQNTLCQEHD